MRSPGGHFRCSLSAQQPPPLDLPAVVQQRGPCSSRLAAPPGGCSIATCSRLSACAENQPDCNCETHTENKHASGCSLGPSFEFEHCLECKYERIRKQASLVLRIVKAYYCSIDAQHGGQHAR